MKALQLLDEFNTVTVDGGFYGLDVPLVQGMEIGRELLLTKLVDIQYTRNDIAFERSQFRVRGDTVDIRPAQTEDAIRVEFFGDEIDRIQRFDPLTGNTTETLDSVTIFPGKQFVTQADKIKAAMKTIRTELREQIQHFEKEGKLLEAQRIKMLQRQGGPRLFNRHGKWL